MKILVLNGSPKLDKSDTLQISREEGEATDNRWS